MWFQEYKPRVQVTRDFVARVMEHCQEDEADQSWSEDDDTTITPLSPTNPAAKTFGVQKSKVGTLAALANLNNFTIRIIS